MRDISVASHYLKNAVAKVILAGSFLALLMVGTFATAASNGFTSSTLTSPQPISSGNFGYSVSTNGKYVVVGAPYETSGSLSYAGNAYILSASTGSIISNLTSPQAETSGNFGYSVSTNGKYVVVGAPFESSGGYASAGNAYIFTTSGSLVSTLTSPNAQSDGLFGVSVSTNGNYVIVGADGESSNGQSFAGNAYVFDASTGALISNLTSPNAQLGGLFGYSVSIVWTSGSDVLVGAPEEMSNGQSFAGNAYVFDASTGALISSLTSPNPQTDGLFGYSVSTSGKYMAVGAPFENPGGQIDAGNAYVFTSSGSLMSTLTSPNPESYGMFGYSVSTNGNFIVVGAPDESSGGYSSAGNVYVYNASSGSLMSTLTSPNAQSSGNFGYSVSAVWTNGKYVIVGAPDELSGGQPSAGNAYNFT